MKLKLILIIFLILLISCDKKRDIEQENYVSDVETLEYVTINFCVDENGNNESVKIIQEKTTYKNKLKIEKIIQQNKNIKYSIDSKLNGKCFDYSYRFINKKYKNKIVNEDECKNYEYFKRGNFKYSGIINTDVKIIRTDSTQVEIDGKSKFVYDINWQSNCEYSLTYKKVSDKKFNYLIGKTIKVKIIDTLPNESYLFKANLLNRTITTGIMMKK